MRKKTDALIMAAGIGTRMLPLTEKYAKPLVPLCGTTMIETIIDALNKNDVGTIFIVVGYKSEQFEFLKKKYPNITLVKNDEYQHKNNISSLMAAAGLLGEHDCYICEADLFVSDSSVFCDTAQSCYFGKFVEGFSEDWVFETKDNIITEIRKKGENLYNMTGLSFWRQADLCILLDAVRKAYKKPGHENLFWDEVVNANLHKIKLAIKPVSSGQIVEIDTIPELEEFIKSRG